MTDKDVNKKNSPDLVPNEIDQLTKAMENYSSSWLGESSSAEKDDFALVTDVSSSPSLSPPSSEHPPKSITTELEPYSDSGENASSHQEREEIRAKNFEKAKAEAKRIEDLAEELATKDRRNSPKKHQEFMSEEEALSRSARSKDRVLIPTVYKESDNKKTKKKTNSSKSESGNSLIPRLAKGKDSFHKTKTGSTKGVLLTWFTGLSYLALIVGAVYGHGNQVLDEGYGKLQLYGLDIPDPRDYEFINPFAKDVAANVSSASLPAVIFSEPPAKLETPNNKDNPLLVNSNDAASGEVSPPPSLLAHYPAEQDEIEGDATEETRTPEQEIENLQSTATPTSFGKPDAVSKKQEVLNLPPASLEITALSCRTWESLDSISADQLTSNLNKMRAKYTRSEKDQPKFYVVAIDPSRAPQDYAQKLASKGVKETFRIKDEGPLKNFISLGQFKFRSSAVKHKSNLEGQGVDFLVIAGHKTTKVTTFKAKLDSSAFSKLPVSFRKISKTNC